MRIAITALTLAALAAPALGQAPEVYDKKCKACHSIGGQGGPMAKMGGPLDGVGAKHDEAYLKAYLTDPKSKKPDTKMPKVTLTDDEMNAILARLP